ncbi:MAG: MBL fold metallo-hydrolase [Methylococcaceae bacterium]|nr:MBL fold metallo-hydrolase [Methylococcaceae bacterium]MCI0733348.1 MBL fold metallo-hydrolase [Methylococcaceae bacterium]
MIFHELNNSICKTYLIACEATGHALLVDPVATRIDRYLAVLAYHHLKLDYLLDTHTHADHRSACGELSSLTGAKVVRHLSAPQPNVDIHVQDGDLLEVGNLSLKILYTPGHTPDSVSVLAGDRVLSGDCLLIGGTGRTDFASGDAGQQYESITRTLFSLPDDTLVFPGHDYRGNKRSTIGHEKRHNPRIANKTREEYIEIMAALGLPLPEQIQEVLQVNATDLEDSEITYPSIAELNKVFQMSPEMVRDQISGNAPPLIIDVRQADEFNGELGHLAGSVSIPLNRLAAKMTEYEAYKDRKIITVCRAGVRSTTAAAILNALHFTDVHNLKGGMIEWVRSGYPVQWIE